MYPVEIWENILKYGYAKDLIRLRRVSRTWDAIITQILDQQGDVWYRQCVEDIPETMWSSLVEHKNDQDIKCKDLHRARNNQSIWREMYRSWREWHRIVQKTPHIGTLEPLPHYWTFDRITCIAALRNIVAIGSTEGCITFYNIASDRIFYRADHTEYLKDVQLFQKGEVVIAVSLSSHHRIKFWNLETKEEEITIRCRGSFITSSFANCFIIRDNHLAVYRLSECFDDDRQSRKSMETIVSNYEIREIFDLDDEIVAAGADVNQVTVCTEKNKNVIINYENGNSIRAVSVNRNKPEIPIRYYQIFKARVAACIGVYGEIGFSIDGGKWKIYNLLGKFGAPVTTVFFHIAILALGLQSGEVHLFRIENVESLENLDFDTLKSKKLLLDTQAITKLNVTEYNSAQYVVASGTQHLHLVKFT